MKHNKYTIFTRTNDDKYTISDEKIDNDGNNVVEIETDSWSIEIAEVDNYIEFWLHGKHDGRERRKIWSQSRRFFVDRGDRR